MQQKIKQNLKGESETKRKRIIKAILNNNHDRIR